MFQFLKSKLNSKLDSLSCKADLDCLYNQLSAYIQLCSKLSNDVYIKQLRGWAMSPDALLAVAEYASLFRPRQIVEFGAGQSTIVLADIARRMGDMHVVTVEHDPIYLAQVQEQLSANGLSQFVDTKLCKLKEYVDHACVSYDLEALGSFEIDMAIVDGPPIFNGLLTRHGPLKWSVDNLRNGVIFLDDANRDAERACVEKLKREVAGITVEHIACEKGLVRMHRMHSEQLVSSRL